MGLTRRVYILCPEKECLGGRGIVYDESHGVVSLAGREN